MPNIKIQDIDVSIGGGRSTRDFVYVRIPVDVLTQLSQLGLTGSNQDKIFKVLLNVLKPEDVRGTYLAWKRQIQIKKQAPEEDEQDQPQ